MKPFRVIQRVTSGTITIPVPESLLDHQVEVILLPIDEPVPSFLEPKDEDAWHRDFVQRYAGSLPDFPDV
jgi:hypothetical protein